MMSVKHLQICIDEAERFIDKAVKAQEEIEKDEYSVWVGNRHTAAAKRASMDLTRALADLRKRE